MEDGGKGRGWRIEDGEWRGPGALQSGRRDGLVRFTPCKKARKYGLERFGSVYVSDEFGGRNEERTQKSGFRSQKLHKCGRGAWRFLYQLAAGIEACEDAAGWSGCARSSVG